MGKSRKEISFPWLNYDPERTKAGHGEISSLLNNQISLSVAPSSTHFDSLLQIGSHASRPFNIKSLSEELKKRCSIRGNTYFGEAASEIDRVLGNYPSLRWWMERDGLVVDEVSPALRPISPFDRIAGSLVAENRKDGRLSESSLLAIAARLDAKGFKLKEFLEPAQIEPLSAYNLKYSMRAIKTFAEAAAHPKFVRNVRKRLCRAHDRFQEFQRASEPIS